MIDANVIARTHFTSKVDGRNSFNQFIKDIGLEYENLPFEYEEGLNARGKRITFMAESWGGYTDMSGRWVIFIAWRCASIKVTRQLRWFWDSKQQKPYGREEQQFCN